MTPEILVNFDRNPKWNFVKFQLRIKVTNLKNGDILSDPMKSE